MRGAGARERRWFAGELVVLGLLVGFETFCAMRAFPQMDDAYLLLLLKERGAAAIGAAHRDRPLVGALWQWLAGASGASFWSVGFALHFLLWLALGLLSSALWRRVFPGWDRYATVVGALAVAPIVVRTQFSTVTISLLCVLSVVVAWTAVLLVWRFAEGGGRIFVLIGLPLAGAAALFSEYGVAAAVSGATLLALAPWPDPPSRARALKGAGGLGVLAVAGYAVYVRMGSFDTRPLVDPARQLGRLEVLTRTPWNVATRFWDALFGDLCRAAAAFQLEWQSKSSLAVAAFGLVVAAALWITVGDAGASPTPPRLGRRLAAAGVALAIGLTPVALMRPVFRSAFASRFEIPVLPLAASCSIAVVLAVVDLRFHRLAAAGIGVLVGMAVAREAGEAVRQRNAMAAAAGVLAPLVRARAGVTSVVLSDRDLCHTAQVCTGAISRDWPAELSRKLWVETSEEALATLGRRSACKGSALTGLSERSFDRETPVDAPLWLDFRGSVPLVEPYCMVASDPPENRMEAHR